MSDNILPDGFEIIDEPNGVRSWVRDDRVYVIAKPHPIAGFSQWGWAVKLVSPFGFAECTILYDELDGVAAFHCRMFDGLLDALVVPE